ncbi:MAG TPA: glycosyltransferase [Acidobacteriota bacterium]|nr:glycosyltransferase [Acidobacteriota bacterium]
MAMVLLVLAAATLPLLLAVAFELWRGNRSTGFLKDVYPQRLPSPPRVSVIIPARNEEENIEPALRSVLDQDYGNLEIIVVDDRSTDRTSAILGRLKESNLSVKLIRVDELPAGWLGKNHALQLGARQAGGALLLFTDADVVMHRSTVSRAVGYMVTHELEHLAVSPEVRMPGLLLQIYGRVFSFFFAMYARPWQARDPASRGYIGIGAFNLIRSGVYRAVGGHSAIALRPDDDMKLGQLIKQAGYRQELLFGRGLIAVPWYTSIGALARGMEKNAFAAVQYRVTGILVVTAGQLLFFVWPFLGLGLTSGITQVLNAGIVAVIVFLGWEGAPFHFGRRWHSIGFPVGTLLLVYILWRSMLKALVTREIQWRGTTYSLSELRANRVDRSSSRPDRRA